MEDRALIVRQGADAYLALLACSDIRWRQSVETGWYSPVYGQKIRNQVLKFRCSTKGSTQIAFAMEAALNAKPLPASFERGRVNSGGAHAYLFSGAEHDSMLVVGSGEVWSAQEITSDARVFYYDKKSSAPILAFCEATTLSISGKQMIRPEVRVRRYEWALRDGKEAIVGSQLSAVSGDLPNALREVNQSFTSVGVS